ncbi:MAG: segregation/condensation protein A [Oscillospiraceae bacterium]|jgi:segregation and condensation protein A|nr:segregation/condensation protein A [Oscillospiraceae bacterium]
MLIHLSQFEGPLDLLLHLIDQAQIDVRDIFVSSITEQYISSLEDISELDMDAASAFLEMAATLLWIKSRALLPKPPPAEAEEESPEEALARRLEEHREIKARADQLRASESGAANLISKLPEELPDMSQPVLLTNLTPEGLTKAWLRLMKRLREREYAANAVAPTLAPSLRRDPYTIGQCMTRLLDRLRFGGCSFESLFNAYPTRGELVTTFIALLELIRDGSITARQTDVYGMIWIERLNS